MSAAFGTGSLSSSRRPGDPSASNKWALAYEKTSKTGNHFAMYNVKPNAKTALSSISSVPHADYTRTGSYQGSWEGNKRHGVGTQVFTKDGSRYEGEWNNDERDGRGSLFVQRKDNLAGGASSSSATTTTTTLVLSYKGEWRGGLRHGRGEHYYANGDV